MFRKKVQVFIDDFIAKNEKNNGSDNVHKSESRTLPGSASKIGLNTEPKSSSKIVLNITPKSASKNECVTKHLSNSKKNSVKKDASRPGVGNNKQLSSDESDLKLYNKMMMMGDVKKLPLKKNMMQEKSSPHVKVSTMTPQSQKKPLKFNSDTKSDQWLSSHKQKQNMPQKLAKAKRKRMLDFNSISAATDIDFTSKKAKIEKPFTSHHSSVKVNSIGLIKEKMPADLMRPTGNYPFNNSYGATKEKRRIVPPSLKGKKAPLSNPGIPRALRMIPTGRAAARPIDKTFLHGREVVEVVGPVSQMTACPVCQGK